MNNRTKVLLLLAITGWLRVLFIVIPIGLVYFGIIDTKDENIPETVTIDTEYVKK